MIFCFLLDLNHGECLLWCRRSATHDAGGALANYYVRIRSYVRAQPKSSVRDVSDGLMKPLNHYSTIPLKTNHNYSLRRTKS